MSTGFTWPWEQAALRGDELPEGLPLPDQMAYVAMRHIYRMYHDLALSRERAAEEKLRLRREYDRAVGQLEFSDKLCRHHARLLRDTEAAKTACRKEPSAENAMRLCDVLDGLERWEA